MRLLHLPRQSTGCSRIWRVLRSGGRVGISDLSRAAELSKQLEGLLAWIACIADAQPVERYVEYFRSAGLLPGATEARDDALIEMARQIQAKLLGIEILSGLKKIDLPELDLTAAKEMAKAAIDAIGRGQLGYVLVTANKPPRLA